ncbi:hypothetical protein QCD61_19340 [Pseudomonas viciae]|uniref:Uncharacterized protein n=1 Tax=Pseudomonas viciae TaxID=2505979 RepID=A0ABY8P9F9_9PSED|nr:hypothetical protein [Pseudomonas viciae]WGO91852.1 hypothetical protein QCD61_19340 [Pseudomonas viciae]
MSILREFLIVSLEAIPTDLKRAPHVGADALDLFKNSRLFHFVFLLKGHREAIGAGSGQTKLSAHRSYLEAAVKLLSEAGYPKVMLKPFRKLLELSKVKTFNLKLMSDLVLVSAILAAITAMLVKNNAKIVWLFPDRDKITEWCDGIYSDLVQNFVPGILAVTDLGKRNYEIKRAVPAAFDGRFSWIDAFVRLPDYMAGTVAGWHVENGVINTDKREMVFMHSIVDAKNVAIFRLCFEPDLYLEKIVVARK